MTPRPRAFGIWLSVPIWLIAVGLPGCGRSGPTTHPVIGRVVFRDGRPVTSGVVEFTPVAVGPSARGKIGPDGAFQLSTGDDPGAVPGLHRVVVVQLSPQPSSAQHRLQHKSAAVHPRYARAETSALTRQVEGKANELVIEVDPAP